MSAKDSYSCARGVGGHIRCWGENQLGQLGDGTTEDSPTPVEALVAPLRYVPAD